MHPSDSFKIEAGRRQNPVLGDEASAPERAAGRSRDARTDGRRLLALHPARSPATTAASGSPGSTRPCPKGLLAKLAGIPYCSDGRPRRRRRRRPARKSRRRPSCPAASRVGSVTVGAGAGPSPVLHRRRRLPRRSLQRRAAEPRGRSPPPSPGPSTSATSSIRNALYVDPASAQVSAVSDPIPSILEGIPLDLRSIVAQPRPRPSSPRTRPAARRSRSPARSPP